MEMKVVSKALVFVQIKPKDGKIYINWGWNTLSKKEEDGRISCYLPGYDIYFSAKDEQSIMPKSETITKMYFDHFMLHNKNRLKALALQLHKLGFKAPNDAFTLQRIIKNEKFTSKFSISNPLPKEFENAHSIIQESELEVANY